MSNKQHAKQEPLPEFELLLDSQLAPLRIGGSVNPASDSRQMRKEFKRVFEFGRELLPLGLTVEQFKEAVTKAKFADLLTDHLAHFEENLCENYLPPIDNDRDDLLAAFNLLNENGYVVVEGGELGARLQRYIDDAKYDAEDTNDDGTPMAKG